MPQSTALLNWASQYSTISPFLSSTTGSADWLRIFISPDATGGGHFITHGIDFGASYANGARGLVPANGGTLNKTYLRGDGWAALWTSAAETAAAVGDTAAQQQAAKEAYLQSTIASVYDIKQWIAQSFAANNAMRFKGTINIDNSENISTTTESGTVAGFPTSCEVGDTYKINGTSGNNSQIANEPVSTGDMIICIKSGNTGNLNTATYWAVVQDNVEHLITYTVNGTTYRIYAQTPNNISVYAPTTYGTTGWIAVAQGEGAAPIWKNPTTILVGEASKVTNALTAGAGITMLNGANTATSYNGSVAITIKLTPATTSTIGGVIVDAGDNSEAYNATSNTSHTAYPTITVNNDGEIYLSKQNIINALGFTPGNSTVNIGKVVVTGTASGTANTTAITANPYINIIASDNSVLGSYRISGSGKITVSSTANSAALVVSLGAADSSEYGGIKLGYTESGKNYAIQLDANGKAFVNVPWVSDVFTASANGLAPAASDDNKSTAAAGTTTYLLGADAKWYKLPASAFQGDRRIVQLNGTTVIGAASGNALNVIPGTHISVTAAQSSGNYTGAMTFNAIWRDIQIRLIGSGGTITQNVSSIGDNDPLVFDNTDTVFMLGEEVTVGSGANATKKTVVKSYITWYNMDTGEYEII